MVAATQVLARVSLARTVSPSTQLASTNHDLPQISSQSSFALGNHGRQKSPSGSTVVLAYGDAIVASDGLWAHSPVAGHADHQPARCVVPFLLRVVYALERSLLIFHRCHHRLGRQRQNLSSYGAVYWR
ncbi:hypothetical protein OF83DRAFT_666037 [Amylostereum chailletii]|nr:hypothetical protein OF83DRAFT_666037 [Amylostereum chailletii]